jgi:5-methylcytosine-specific restriction endonuclease McrA
MHRWEPQALFFCPGCKKEVLVRARDVRSRKFCSRSCASSSHPVAVLSGSENPNWRGGKAVYYGPGWKAVKAQVRERDRRCRECGKAPAENGRALDVHHIEPFRFSGDNSLSNLVALCRSCHMRADDHGRKGSAVFLAKAGTPRPPSKRELRRRAAAERARRKAGQKKSLQRYAFHLHALGRSLREIARAVGVSHQTVANWLAPEDGRLASSGPGQSVLSGSTNQKKSRWYPDSSRPGSSVGRARV